MKTQTLAKAARTLLLSGAAAGALMAFAVPAQASTQSDKAEIALLKAQVDALAARLDAAEAAQRSTQDQAAQAQATAAQAQATAANADAQIQTLPTQVKTAVAAIPAPTPKKSWADDTVVSGRMYFNLSNIEQKTNGAKVAPSGTGLEIKRFYLGVDHKFNDVYSANLTLDVNYVANDSETQVYVKKAYLQAKYSDALTVRLGSADLPWVPYAEDLYGYRYIENTVIDRDKFGTSADWGIHALGKFGDSGLSYAVALIDGAGYKAPLRSKGMDVEGRLSYKVSDFNFAIGGYTGKLGKDIEGTLPVVRHTASRFDAIAAYTTKTVRVGVEYFSAEDWNTVTSVAADKSDGYSVFGSYRWDEKWSVFGRFDDVTPKKDLTPNLGDKYFNIGVTYSPTKIVDLALVYKRDKIDNGSLSTSNGTIGGATDGTYDELGLFGQLRW
jgi:hypothetical protein